ncbi:MAG: DUF2116 family Zn-ribbon domain-containing protein [Candidatus Thermoplasmatota archaeon]|nr:DUF2116 family Zn-ribbon domain-containing protein [Candidatus Thermoplasmatota archaeon]
MEQHKHCKICAKPIPLDEDFCSEKCREEYQDMVSERKKKQYIFYALLAVLIVVVYFSFAY